MYHRAATDWPQSISPSERNENRDNHLPGLRLWLRQCHSPLIQRGQTGREYIAARLQRDNPEVFQKYLGGEIPSLHKAAEIAKIKRVYKPLPMDDPLAAAATIRRYYQGDKLQEIIEHLQSPDQELVVPRRRRGKYADDGGILEPQDRPSTCAGADDSGTLL